MQTRLAAWMSCGARECVASRFRAGGRPVGLRSRGSGLGGHTRLRAADRSPASDLDDHRDDHRPPAVVVVHPLADGAADELAELVRLVDPVGRRAGQRLLEQRADLVEAGLVDAGAPGMDLRPGHQLAVGHVDHTTTETNPSSPRIRRSFSEVSVTSPTESPSTNTYPQCTLPVTDALPPTRSTTMPSSATTMFSAGTPVSAASSACALRCRHSPCTGMKLLGLTMFST